MTVPGTAAVHDLLDTAAARFPRRVAVRDPYSERTYAQLRQDSITVAGSLRAAGVGPGDRVLCLVGPRWEHVALLYATVRLGAVFVPVHSRSSDYQTRWLVADARPALIVADGRVPTGPPRPAPDDAVNVVDVAELFARRPRDPVAPDPPAGTDTALMLYTSGTTARPKAVVSHHAHVVFAAGAVAARLGYTADDVVYLRLPLSFDYGLYQIFLCTLAGSTLVLGDDTPGGALVGEVRAAGATVLPVVPTLAELLTWLAGRDTAPTALRLITNTGAALTARHATGLAEAVPGAAVVAMYGTTECKRISIAAPNEHLVAPGTVGTPIPGTRALVVDEHDRVLPAGATGQIVAVGPHVMAGYWGAPELSAQRFRPAPDTGEPAVHTGDYGHADGVGRLWVAGRRDDLFKRRGVRTGAQEIEAAMLDVPGVRAAAVLPPGPDGRLVAWAVGSAAPKDILGGVGQRLGRAKVPDICLMTEELPRTANGKVDKAALRAESPTHGEKPASAGGSRRLPDRRTGG